MARGMAQIKMEGFEQAIELLKNLPDAVQRKVMLANMRIATVPLINEARNNASDWSRRLARSIGNITGRSKNYPTIYVGPRVKGKFKDDGWFGHFVEFGTSGIISKKGRKGFVTKRSSDNEAYAIFVGKKKVGDRYRADQPARPFMRPAIDTKKAEVESILKEKTIINIEKFIKNYAKQKNRR